jgi:methionyl-tRNA synthetase
LFFGPQWHSASGVLFLGLLDKLDKLDKLSTIMTLDEFQKADLRVAKIVSAERVEGSEKLLKLQIDLGDESRQIISGIAKSYAPEDLVGKQVVAIANLEPRTIMGLESHGMLLAAHGENGEPVILTVESPVPAGAKVS